MRTWYRSRNTSGFPLYWRSSSCLRSARLSSGSPICWLFTGLPLRATASTMSITHADSFWISSCNCGQGHCQQKKRSSPVMLLCCWTHQVRCLWLLRRYRECYMPLKWLCRRIFWLFDSVHILVFTQAWLRFDWRLNFAPHFNLLPKNDSAYLAANVINCLGRKVKRTYVQRTLLCVLPFKCGHLSKIYNAWVFLYPSSYFADAAFTLRLLVVAVTSTAMSVRHQWLSPSKTSQTTVPLGSALVFGCPLAVHFPTCKLYWNWLKNCCFYCKNKIEFKKKWRNSIMLLYLYKVALI